MSDGWQKNYLEGMEQVVDRYKQLNDVEYIPDVPFESQDNVTLAMDIFRPWNAGKESLPVVLMVHGGGLLMGDRHMEMGICRNFAKAGFLSVSIEYRVFPESDIKGAVLDLAGGMEYIGRNASRYGGDADRIYLVCESAGVFASIFALSMIRSETVRKAFGGRSPDINIRAMAAQSGMFYVRRKDIVGMVMSGNVIPTRWGNRDFLKILDTEQEEILNSIPPVFLVSSKGDFLRKYTLKYSDFLKNNKKEYRLIYYDKAGHLPHAFCSLAPELPESIEVGKMIVSWFLEH